MALVACADCGTQVSTRATACPKCGAPVGAPAPASTEALPPDAKEVVTTQLTSKALKQQQLFAGLLCVVSVIGMIASDSGGGKAFWVFGLLGGLVWFIVTRFRAWWHHG
jgi:hypothetical protein